MRTFSDFAGFASSRIVRPFSVLGFWVSRGKFVRFRGSIIKNFLNSIDDFRNGSFTRFIIEFWFARTITSLAFLSKFLVNSNFALFRIRIVSILNIRITRCWWPSSENTLIKYIGNVSKSLFNFLFYLLFAFCTFKTSVHMMNRHRFEFMMSFFFKQLLKSLITRDFIGLITKSLTPSFSIHDWLRKEWLNQSYLFVAWLI